jgi:hypothetical protein
LESSEGFSKLYEGQWGKSVPGGLAEGVLRNAKSDLLFAMERLSVYPDSLRRVKPNYSAVLPMHPLSLYQLLPKKKGTSSLMPFRPDLKDSIHKISLAAAFNQPGVPDTPDSL